MADAEDSRGSKSAYTPTVCECVEIENLTGWGMEIQGAGTTIGF